jgi:acetyltransferase-like isoleucine patch superfamily enzyme
MTGISEDTFSEDAVPEDTSPDRPIASRLVPLRKAVRKARLLQIQAMSGRKVSVGENFAIGKGAQIRCPNFFRAADDVSIGLDFLCEVDLTIGSGVLISSRVCFIGNDHKVPPAGTPLFTAGRMPNSHIQLEGDNPNTIVAGRPAKPIRSR